MFEPPTEKDHVMASLDTVQTPVKMTDFNDMESTLAPDSLNTEQQFDMIASKVNDTIQDLNRIYTLIGYTETEIGDKKNDIFVAIQETISSFAQNLQREKNNIQNECEWLRQQIRIILAMLNDTQGEKTLKLSSRGVVFEDAEMYRNGYKEDVLQQMNNYQCNFYTSSPFNLNLPSDDFSMQQQYEYMVEHTPELSLLQLKARLNTVFLDVLRAFVAVFTKFNDLTLVFWDNIDTVGECWNDLRNAELIKSLHTKDEAEELSALIREFTQTIGKLKLSEHKDLMVGPKGNIQNDFAFIVSSPRKPKELELESVEDMEHLRNINYKIVRSIRGLKLTKVTSEVVSSLAKVVDWTETEIEHRKNSMRETITQCLSLIKSLALSKHDVISIQKMRDLTDRDKSNENYFDVETLKFIGENPREFGLMDHHLQFVSRLANSLQSLKDAKQKKWDFYSNACVQLWEKLGENREYILLFLETNAALTDMSLSNLKMELNRLYIKRSEFIDTFIADVRTEIEQYQNALLYSESQRRNFKYYHLSDETDKELVLKEHEDEVARLKAEYAQREPILSLYSQLKELLDDQNFLVESSKDSSRLLSKNSCKILLNEEKIRKKINKSMPRVIEALKQETIKYNNEQLSQGLRPMAIDGQDFFERILLIESEQANQNNSKFGRGRKIGRPEISKPRTARANSRSPTKVSKIPKSISPTMRQTSAGNISPRRAFNATSKTDKALKSAVGRESIASSSRTEISPKRTNSSMLSRLGTHLQPLNSPLNLYSDSEARDRSENSTLYSMCTRVSPLRSDLHSNMTNFSPIRPFENEGKENESLGKFSLSPIRVLSGIHPENKRLSSNSLANSTIIGDDYQQWRDERIKQINGM